MTVQRTAWHLVVPVIALAASATLAACRERGEPVPDTADAGVTRGVGMGGPMHGVPQSGDSATADTVPPRE